MLKPKSRQENLVNQIENHSTAHSFQPSKWLRKHFLLLLTVIIPTTVSIVYFGLIASDVYISESKFVVRSPQKPAATGLGALLQSSGFTKSQDDVYTVDDYMTSRDALSVLDRAMNLRAVYGAPADLVSRFGGPFGNATFEELYKYYGDKIKISQDSSSSISTLQVRAFTAADAFKINEQLLELSEALVNRMNERGQGDLVHYAEKEVAEANESMRRSADELAAYRNKQGIFDTDKQSALQLQQVSKLQDQLVATISQLNQIKALAPDNPQIPVLETQRGTLQAEIEKETLGVAGSHSSLSTQSADYQRLQLNNAFAEKQLGAALASLEQAKSDAYRKQLYIERIVQPNKPDYALEPRRFFNILATFALGVIIWGVLSMLIAGVREHQD